MLNEQAAGQGHCDAALSPAVASGPGLAVSDDLFSAPVAGTGDVAPQTACLRALFRFKWTIAVVFVLITGPAISAIWLLVTPQYRARATVEVSPTSPRVLYKTEDNGLIPMYQQYLNSQVGIIAGNKVLQRVVERKDLKETAWYRDPPWRLFGRADSHLERLRKDLEVRPRGRTFLIDIDFVAAVPEDARVIVGAVLEEYRAEARNRVEDTDVMVLGTLARTLKGLNISIAGREKVAEELRRGLGTNTPEELISQKRLRLDQLEARMREVGRDVKLADWRRRQLEDARRRAQERHNGEEDEADQAQNEQELVRQKYEGDTEWWRLYLSLREARLKLDLEGNRFGQEHPTMVRLKEEVQRVEQMLRNREGQLLQTPTTTSDPAADNAEGGVPLEVMLTRDLGALQKERELLEQDFEQRQACFDAEFDKATQLVAENEELLKQKSKADFVRARLDEKETERGPIALIREVSRPLTPSRPHRDRRPVLTVLALLLGLAGGVALAFVRSTRNQTIHEADELAAACRAPFLGLLPLSKANGFGDECLTEQEYYRMLRTALLNRLDGRRGRVALITSGGPGVGKTTVAVMLAKSLARCGKRVLLVDADVRAPGVAQRLGIRSEPGLVELLSGQADDAGAIVAADTPGLSVLPASRAKNGSDSELLANGVFAGCLERWREKYDVVLLDSPPVLPVADARILSRYADGTILIVREGYCRQLDIVKTLASLGISGGKLFGTVYIGARQGSGYYNYAQPAYGP